MTSDNIAPLLADLRTIPAIADLPEEQLSWLARRITEQMFRPGDLLAKEGDPANFFYILVEGEVQFRRESDPQDTRVVVVKAGDVGGKLPYSRLTEWPGSVRAITEGRALVGSTDIFPEMQREAPLIVQRMVNVMSDRIRFMTREDQQRDKMAALGKLSAGLAHELNNPAAAARRAALGIAEVQDGLREALRNLDVLELSPEQRQSISSLEQEVLKNAETPASLDSLTQSEREDEVTNWLESHGVSDGWKLAAVLAEARAEIPWLEKLLKGCGEKALGHAVRRIFSQLLLKRLTREIESSAGRISELVKAIKEYSYMDQAPVQEIDLHHGIESTLVMLGYKLKHGIAVERIYDKSLPRVCVYGSELNQVWTNLIDNAADAMKDGGRITIRTALDRDCAVVEICDTGSGIPREIQDKIFEPFFTTKKVGEGTGLGLDTVYRVVRKHHGTIRVESQPGNTRFVVRLPLKQPKTVVN